MPGARTTLAQRQAFATLLAQGASIEKAGRGIGVSPATAYRLANRIRSQALPAPEYLEILCPSCDGNGRLLWPVGGLHAVKVPKGSDGPVGLTGPRREGCER